MIKIKHKGKTYKGKSIILSDNKVIVDGKEQKGLNLNTIIVAVILIGILYIIHTISK